MPDIHGLFRRIILANELANNPALAYRFSDPDGVRTGKSGWSFGVCQFDINNNPSAILCLREAGYTTDEIAGLKTQSVRDMAPLNAKLRSAAAVVDRWDARQLAECVETVISLAPKITDLVTLHLADYHNQFYMSRGGKMHRFIQGLRTVQPDDILRFKLSLPWGEKRPDDVERRYNTINRLWKDAQA